MVAGSVKDAAHPALDGLDQERAQRRGRDDAAHGPHPHGALDAVDGVEPLGELPALAREDLGPQRSLLGAQALALRALGVGDPLVERRDPLVAARRLLDLAGEDDRGGRRSADHRGVRALERDRLEVGVQLL